MVSSAVFQLASFLNRTWHLHKVLILIILSKISIIDSLPKNNIFTEEACMYRSFLGTCFKPSIHDSPPSGAVVKVEVVHPSFFSLTSQWSWVPSTMVFLWASLGSGNWQHSFLLVHLIPPRPISIGVNREQEVQLSALLCEVPQGSVLSLSAPFSYLHETAGRHHTSSWDEISLIGWW